MNTTVQATSSRLRSNVNNGMQYNIISKDSGIISTNYIGSETSYTVSDEQRNSIVTDKCNSETQ